MLCSPLSPVEDAVKFSSAPRFLNRSAGLFHCAVFEAKGSNRSSEEGGCWEGPGFPEAMKVSKGVGEAVPPKPLRRSKLELEDEGFRVAEDSELRFSKSISSTSFFVGGSSSTSGYLLQVLF